MGYLNKKPTTILFTSMQYSLLIGGDCNQGYIYRWTTLSVMLNTLLAAQPVPVTGTPFDCDWRKHAWEFAKQTLPQHKTFRTAFDALQLNACGLSSPANDMFRPPVFPAPARDVWYVDAAVEAGGDGSLVKPFGTLEEGITAAGAAASGPKALLLRAGTYHTPGVVLTPSHSGLVILNYNGEEAIVSGAVPVPVSKAKWYATAPSASGHFAPTD